MTSVGEVDPATSIAFQGVPGAYSDLACRERAIRTMTTLPCADVRGRLRRGARGPARAGHDPDRELGRRPRRRHPSPAARFGPAHRRRALPAREPSAAGAQGRDASRASATVHSHVHALCQCRKLHAPSSASSRWCVPTPPARPRRSPRAATRPMAAIASALAGEIYGLDSPARQHRGRRRTTRRASWSWRASRSDPEPDNGPVVTSFVFRVRSVPAALYKALGGFATNGVNMTKLESYMIDGALHRRAVLCRHRGPPRRTRRSPRARGAAASSRPR